jgi:hypothetical protein
MKADPIYAAYVRIGREEMHGKHPRRWSADDWRDAKEFLVSRILVGEQEARQIEEARAKR